MIKCCLVRTLSCRKDQLDKVAIDQACVDCNKGHSWNLQRAFLQGAVLGLYDDESIGQEEVGLVEVQLSNL